MVVVGGVAWGPRAKLDNYPGWQFDVGYPGVVAIKPINIIQTLARIPPDQTAGSDVWRGTVIDVAWGRVLVFGRLWPATSVGCFRSK